MSILRVMVIDVLVWLVFFIVMFWLMPKHEGFRVSLPSALGGRDLLVVTMNEFSLGGFDIARLTPFTCPVNKPDLDAGLCYEKCRDGFRGVGPVCWANSQGIGVGTPVGLEPCPDGWNNDGLVCREPISCKSIGDCFSGRGCGCSGGNIRGRLNNGGVCPGPGGDEYKDKVDGLCYKQCPTNLPVHLPGMPYLCYKGGALSYGRGVGQVPSILRFFGKYTVL
jgi:hypothetical protein